MIDSCLLILSGLPASGKTTLAKELVNNPCPNKHVVIISYDKLMPTGIAKHLIETTAETDSEMKEHLSSQWKSYREQIVSCVDHSLNWLAEGSAVSSPPGVSSDLWESYKLDVFCGLQRSAPKGALQILVVDDNMFYSSMRRDYYVLARKYGCRFCQVFLDTPTESAIIRNQTRDGDVTENTIVTMAARFEPPNPESHTWEQNSVTCSLQEALNNHCECVMALVERASPVLPLPDEEAVTARTEAARQTCSSSALYQADQILRKMVAENMSLKNASGVKPKDLQLCGRQLAAAKAGVLDAMRSGEITIPALLCTQVDGAASQHDNAYTLFVRELFMDRLRDTSS